MPRLRKFDKIVASLFPHLKDDKKAMAVRVATAESMVKEGWKFEEELVVSGGVVSGNDKDSPSQLTTHNSQLTVSLTTPLLRFGYGPYVAESRYRLTPNPGGYSRSRWIVESVDHPEWKNPHPHVYRSGDGSYGLCCDQTARGRMHKEPLDEAMAMAATMSGQVLEGNITTDMRPFADPKLSTASVCPFCHMDVDRRITKYQKNGYFYHPACWKAAEEERRLGHAT